MADLLGALRRFLFGDRRGVRAGGVSLISATTLGELRSASDAELMLLVYRILGEPTYRSGLRGNVRFMESVGRQYHGKRTITPKQRAAVIRILERAYPHNLAAILAASSQ